MNIKKGDNVYVLSGKDKGKKGKVERVFPSIGRAVVSGIGMVTKHQKPQKNVKQVGRINKSMPVNISNLSLICEKCGKHVRVGYRVLDTGEKVRTCKKCGDTI